jgi:hypothetical protein
MKYYEWLGELDAVEIRFPDFQFNGFWMLEGKPVIGWNEYLIAVYLCTETPIFNFGLAVPPWPMFSPQMRSLMENIASDLIQFLPFRFQRPDGTGQVTGYCVGQLLRLVDCLDRDRTKVRNNWEPINERGDFGTYRPIVLSRSLIGEESLFRIKGMCRSIVICEDLKKAIEDGGVKGQRLIWWNVVNSRWILAVKASYEILRMAR